MHPKLVIFDVDGLMLDTESLWQKAWNEVGLRHGIPHLGETTFFKCVGRNGKEVEAIIYQDLQQFGDPKDIFNEVLIYGRQLLKEKIDPKPGIYDLLDLLKKYSIKVAVATSTSRTLTMERLSKLHLAQYFDFFLCGDEVTERKPNPEIYNLVIKYFNIAPQDALVLEDSVVGVEAAFRAHIPCIMIPDLVPASDKQKAETIAVVSSLYDVMTLIEE